MKFSHSLQFNAVPEWSLEYIAYSALKKLIYNLQRKSLAINEDDVESTHLIGGYSSVSEYREEAKKTFLKALDSELEKTNGFFVVENSRMFKSLDLLVIDIEEFERDAQNLNSDDLNYFTLNRMKPLDNGAAVDTSVDDHLNKSYLSETDAEFGLLNVDQDLLEDSDQGGQERSAGVYKSRSVNEFFKSPKSPGAWLIDRMSKSKLDLQLVLSEARMVLRKRVIGLYTNLFELKSYIELNETGFKKALKKFDKSLNTSIKDEYMEKLPNESEIFDSKSMSRIDQSMQSLVELYAHISNYGNDLELAKSELSIHLREHVVWERNTVWRDMIGLERKAQAAITDNDAGPDNKASRATDIQFNFRLRNPNVLKCIAVAFFSAAAFFTPVFEDTQEQRCFGLLILASSLWASETIPLFTTSLLIPVLAVALRILKTDDGRVMDTTSASKYILSTMWSSVIFLLLGGFTLAAALTKYNIAKLLSTWILLKAGTSVSFVLLTVMSIALFASMWVSNVAAPVLCFSLIQPLLRTLPRGSQTIKAFIMGIALASNIGGMASPIASPQNMIAMGEMDPPPSWGQWFVVSIPVCILCLLLCWIFLLVTFDCRSHGTQLVQFRTIDSKLTPIQYFIIGVSISTIFLWCIASKLEGVFGEMGIIAVLPLVVFYGTGILTTDDFNNYPWNIVILAMGGTALGKSVASSGLLATIAISIQKEVEGFSLFAVTLTFGFMILTVATFVSHTVAALIIVPLVSEIGVNLPDPHPRLLVMICALLCSAAMGLPTSGFPNVTAICMTDEFGKPYLTVSSFITRGVPVSFIAYTIIISVGYATLNIINF